MSAFPQLKHLCISSTRISFLPIYYLRTGIRDVRWGRHPPAAPAADELVATRRSLAPIQCNMPCRSLQSYCMAALYRGSTRRSNLLQMGLPAGITNIIAKTYRCEICDLECAGHSTDWLDWVKLFVAVRPYPRERLQGQVCRSCLALVTTPSPEVMYIQ